MKDTVDIAGEIRERLKKAVTRKPAEGLLFSGGVDTSILAVLNPDMKAITVSLESFGEDAQYADLVAKNLKLKHYHRRVNIDEAIDSIPNVIRILKSFDPAIPNDLVVYFGLKLAKEMGIEEVMTGDGSDELFAGYDFMQKIDDLEGYIKKISQNMRFSSNRIGDFFGMKIIQPFLEKEFVNFALSINLDLKLKSYGGKSLGKWILRKAFEDILPKEIIWQGKRALENGSGMTKIREIISNKITDEEFEDKSKQYPIKFMSKEHLYYYRIYKEEVGEISGPEKNQKACPGCGAGMDYQAFHCWVCGNVLDWKK